MKYEIRANEQFKSTEIIFDGKPSESIRNILKANGYRWHKLKCLWYGYKTAEEVKNLLNSASGNELTEEKGAETAGNGVKTGERIEARQELKETATGVKIGDLFVLTWGYEQTNNDFFQVVAVKGRNSVLIKEVIPPTIKEKSDGYFMAKKYAVKVPENGDLCPAAPCSVFIKNQKDGDLKRIGVSEYDGEKYITIDGHRARPYYGEMLYESYYA